MWGGDGGTTSSAFASCAAAFNRLRDSGDGAAAEDLLARARSGTQLEELGKGLHILVKSGASEDMRVARASLEALSLCVEWDKKEETPYGVLLNREELATRPELLVAMVELLRATDLWVRFWALRTLLPLCRGTALPSVRGALLAAPEGPRLLADTVKDAREPVRMAGMEVLRLVGRDCYTLSQLACYGGAVEDLFEAVALAGGIDGSGASQALAAMTALLEGNASNKAHFLLTGGLGRLAPLLALDSSDLIVLTDAKAEGLVETCGVVRALVTGDATVSEAQQKVTQQGLVPMLCRVALGRVPAVVVRLAALFALSATVRGCAGSFATLQLDGGGGLALDRAVTVMLSPAASVVEASAACAVVQSYFWNNPKAQIECASQFANVAPAGGGGVAARLLAAARDESAANQCWFATHVLAEVLRNNAAAQQAALSRAPLLLPSLCHGGAAVQATTAATRGPRVARLRLLAVWIGQCKEAVAALLAGNKMAALVECVMSATSDAHVAAAAAVVLRRLAVGDRATRDVLSKRVGADKFLAAFRAVLRSPEWEEGIDHSDDAQWRRESVLWYPAAWRGSFRDELAAARAQFEPQSSGEGGSVSEAEAVRARAAVAAAEKEVAELKAQLAAARAVAEAAPPPAAAMQLDLLHARDQQIAALKKEAQQLRAENDRLLMLLAEQEMALNEAK